MPNLKDTLSQQRDDHNAELEHYIETIEVTSPEPAPEEVKLLSLSEQIKLSQAKFEETVNSKYSPTYSNSRQGYRVETPYGKVTAQQFWPSESLYVDISCTYTESDKIGRKYLKEHNIKINDDKVAKDITQFYTYQTISSFIEEKKSEMQPQEYKEAHQNIQEELRMVLENLNKKGFFINPKTGELCYQKQNLNLLAQQKSR